MHPKSMSSRLAMLPVRYTGGRFRFSKNKAENPISDRRFARLSCPPPQNTRENRKRATKSRGLLRNSHPLPYFWLSSVVSFPFPVKKPRARPLSLARHVAHGVPREGSVFPYRLLARHYPLEVKYWLSLQCRAARRCSIGIPPVVRSKSWAEARSSRNPRERSFDQVTTSRRFAPYWQATGADITHILRRIYTAMNVFHTHAQIVSDYETYIRSFLQIADPRIRDVVEGELSQGKLWPEPLLQFNPSFEMYGKVDDLSTAGTLHPAIRHIFKGFSLYRHQVEAIKLGTSGKDFIVTSGTGSGKSLTYIGSIFHYLLSHPGEPGVTAVVVYPMNALINSQFDEFTRYKENYEQSTGNEFPITFGQYTGQEKEEARTKMRETPPQILLTNYMMLELLLTRVRERSIRDGIFQNLRFLVFDELHTYRGRQGADVALLVRRIRSRCAHSVTCIGTSATMVSVGTLAEQRDEVARVATKVFGKPFVSDQVVPETLDRSLVFNGKLPSSIELAAAISAAVNPDDDLEKLKTHPVAIWLENKVALEVRESTLVRGMPSRISDIVAALAQESNLPETTCRGFLEKLLQWISVTNQGLQDAGQRYTILPFKLHQFISQTGSVYTTLPSPIPNGDGRTRFGVSQRNADPSNQHLFPVLQCAASTAIGVDSRAEDRTLPRCLALAAVHFSTL